MNMRIENIKFRAWDKVSKQMFKIRLVDLYDMTVYSAKSGDFICSYQRKTKYSKNENFKDVERLVFMQYTGILDKHGKEIYEKDLVKNTETNKVYKVVWNGSSAAFELEDEENQYKSLFFANEGFGRYEIIGNVYENPEEVQ